MNTSISIFMKIRTDVSTYCTYLYRRSRTTFTPRTPNDTPNYRNYIQFSFRIRVNKLHQRFGADTAFFCAPAATAATAVSATV